MTKSGPPTSLEPSEYEAIEQAMMETSRGRWFLAQFAEKNRRQDTQVVLEAIAKLESSVAGARSQPESDRIKTDLVEMSKAIERTRNEIANLKLPEQEGGNLVGATEELDAIVSATERATTKILQAAEDIQETAWVIRENGEKLEAPCARIDTDVTDIYTACSFQDITGQRTQKVVQILRYLESRINAMVSIWGLSTDENQQSATSEESDGVLPAHGRPDAHLLNGPQMEHDALKQHHIDDMMSEAKQEAQEEARSSEELQTSSVEENMDDASLEAETDLVEDETPQAQDENLASLEEDLSLAAEEATAEETVSSADLSSNEDDSELPEVEAPELQAEADTVPDDNSATDNSGIIEAPAEIELTDVTLETEEIGLADDLLSDLEKMAISVEEENLSVPEVSDQVPEEEPAEIENTAPEQQVEMSEIETELTAEPENQDLDPGILEHIENADLPPDDELVTETILAEETAVPETLEDTQTEIQAEAPDNLPDNDVENDERAAFEQHFKKISEELQKAKQLKEQQNQPAEENITEEQPVEEASASNEVSNQETAENNNDSQQEAASEEENEENTAEEIRKLSADKKSALFQ